MGSDIVFKTKAFGGFNKDEVMDFVNKILAEKSELEKRLAEVNGKCLQMDSELREAKSVESELASLKEKLSLTESNLSELSSETESLRASLCEKEDIISSLEEQLEKSKVDADSVAHIDSLTAEINRLKAECDKKRDLERQVGAAMLDARVHSEELVEAAKEKANSVTKSVYAAIGDTALKIDDLSSGIGEIARSFTKSVEEVELRIKALTGDMSKTAQLLISESGIITDSAENSSREIEYDFLTDPGDEI